MISFQVAYLKWKWKEELTHSHDEKHSETLGDLHLCFSFENEWIIPAKLRSFYLNRFSSFFFIVAFIWVTPAKLRIISVKPFFGQVQMWLGHEFVLFFRFYALFLTTFYLLFFWWQMNLDILLNSSLSLNTFFVLYSCTVPEYTSSTKIL